MNAKFDRSYKYDQLSRLVEARTGAEARGQTDAAANIPYFQNYGYNAFGNQTQSVARNYSSPVQTTTTSVVNNRRTDAAYDAEGNVTYELALPSAAYDALGQMTATETSDCQPNDCLIHTESLKYDGDGRLVKKTVTEQYNEDPPITDAIYQLRSTVLGGEVIIEIGATGSVKRLFIRAGGTVVATEQNGTNWMHKDLNLNSIRSTDANGQILGDGSGSSDTDKFELDPMGKNVEFSDKKRLQYCYAPVQKLG